MSGRRQRVAIAVGASLLGVSACLSADERATPGLVTMTIEPSPATTDGFDTADGWRITFDRFVTAAGSVTLDTPSAPGADRSAPESCVDYTGARYDRLFDFAHTARADLGLAYGLGACSARYRLKSPSTDTLIQPGTATEDVTFMRTRATDPWVDDGRVNVWVEGRAVKGTGETRVEKHFDWVFRRGARIARCARDGGEGFVDEITLEADGTHALRAVVRGEELFRADLDVASPLVFEPFAGADADGDGEVTLIELDAVPVSVETPVTTPTGPTMGPFDPVEPPKTLADLVYEWQIRRVGSLAGASDCGLE